MSLAKAQQPQRVLQYIGLAEQQEGGSSALGCLIRLQVQLAQQQQQHVKPSSGKKSSAPAVAADTGDRAAAAAAAAADCIATVEALSNCTDFSRTTMQVHSTCRNSNAATYQCVAVLLVSACFLVPV
jgi:Tfp pilus assembly major pilin PilA